MSIKIVPLIEAIPNSGYDSNKRRSSLLAHAGVAYLEAYEAMSNLPEKGFAVHFVELPLLHMTLELLIKAYVSWIDDSFDPKKRAYRHCTKKIIEDYADKINEFSLIKNNPEKIALIEQLEKAWRYLRYGESTLTCERKDLHMAKDLAIELAEAYHKATGLRFFSHHFSQKGAKR
ncbi:MAG: hypothetical protein HYW47_01755 [Deltaproteobacteria bacterium]|nr:hypothetical protein [Deltaproteobacteria bacterium]